MHFARNMDRISPRCMHLGRSNASETSECSILSPNVDRIGPRCMHFDPSDALDTSECSTFTSLIHLTGSCACIFGKQIERNLFPGGLEGFFPLRCLTF